MRKNKLSINQRKALAEFYGNFAVAWLATGVVAPYVSGQVNIIAIPSAVFSIIWAIFLLGFMLYSTKGGEK